MDTDAVNSGDVTNNENENNNVESGSDTEIEPTDKFRDGHLIKNCCMKYSCWKYWHSPMLHVVSLAIVIIYDMQLEVTKGKLDPDWKLSFPVDFWTFRDILSV